MNMHFEAIANNQSCNTVLTHAIFNTSLTTLQDGIHQWQNEHALRDDCQQPVLQRRPQGQNCTPSNPQGQTRRLLPHVGLNSAPHGQSPAQFRRTKPENWDSMSTNQKENWRRYHKINK
jgi:hypothetical protein